jgi:hypothetical protein
LSHSLVFDKSRVGPGTFARGGTFLPELARSKEGKAGASILEKELIGHCPVCTSRLVATELSCKKCDLKLKGDFIFNKYSYLSKDELEFLEAFLVAEGSFKSIQEKLGITYFKAKASLTDVLDKLGLKDKSEAERIDILMENRITHVNIKDYDHFVTKLIKEKLNESGGQAEIPLIQAGKKIIIGFDSDGSGLICDKIPVPKQLTWEVFIAAYDILIVNDRELYKGYARTGKLGSDRLPIDSLEGYIAYAVHGVEKGGSAFSPGFAIAAILDWVGILKNERGSTLQIVSSATTVESYEEALKNATTFNDALSSSDFIRSRLNFFRHWYYFDEIDMFAPSKFIGYKDMNAKTYEAFIVSDPNNLDGRDTERVLIKYFDEATGEEKDKLVEKLSAFLSQYGKSINAKGVVHVKK